MRLRSVIIVLLGLGVLRLVLLLTHTPVLAYANNYDMNRIQACLHTWPADAQSVGTKSEQAPLTEYVFNNAVDFDCVPASTLVIDAPVAFALHLASATHFSPLAFGAWRAFLLCAVFALFIRYYLQHNQDTAALANAIVFAVVATDPGNTLYLQTFYAEFSALLFFVLTLNCLYVFCLRNTTGWYIALLVSLLLLGTSKAQHLLLPAVLIAPAVLCFPRQFQLTQRWLPLLVVLLLPLLVSSSIHNRETQVMQQANLNHTVASSLYTSAQRGDGEVAKLKQQLGLANCPDTDASVPFRLYHKQLLADCDAVKQVPHRAILVAILQHPLLLASMLEQGFARSRPFVSTTVGHVAGMQMEFIDSHLFSIDRFIRILPTALWFTLALMPLPVLLWAWRLVKTDKPAAAVLAALSLGALEMFAVTVLGDGFFNVQKHLHLWHNSLLVLLMILLVAGWKRALSTIQ